jgi:hypothetical protein
VRVGVACVSNAILSGLATAGAVCLCARVPCTFVGVIPKVSLQDTDGIACISIAGGFRKTTVRLIVCTVTAFCFTQICRLGIQVKVINADTDPCVHALLTSLSRVAAEISINVHATFSARAFVIKSIFDDVGICRADVACVAFCSRRTARSPVTLDIGVARFSCTQRFSIIGVRNKFPCITDIVWAEVLSTAFRFRVAAEISINVHATFSARAFVIKSTFDDVGLSRADVACVAGCSRRTARSPVTLDIGVACCSCTQRFSIIAVRNKFPSITSIVWAEVLSTAFRLGHAARILITIGVFGARVHSLTVKVRIIILEHMSVSGAS